MKSLFDKIPNIIPNLSHFKLQAEISELKAQSIMSESKIMSQKNSSKSKKPLKKTKILAD